MYQDGFRRARIMRVFYNSVNTGNAAVISNGTNFAGLVNRWIEIDVDGAGAPQRVTFQHGDFADPNAPTAAEVVAVLNAGLTGATASALADGRVQVESDTTGGASQITIGVGTANAIFGWPQGFDVDASLDGAILPTYDTEDLPADISLWTYVAATEAYTRIVPLVTEVQDYNGGTVFLPGAAAIRCAKVVF